MSSDRSEWPRHPAFAHWVAGLICILYGFAKLSGAQFTVLDSELSRPMGEVSGFWLTWYYFGYSQVYGTLIAGFQVVAGSLLLVPRVRVLAALLLLPMAVNIVAVDLFYGVDLGGMVAAILLTVCLLLMITPHVRRIWNAVVPATAPPMRRGYVIIPLVLATAWGASYWIANENNRLPTVIDGVWTAQGPDEATSPPGPIAPSTVFFERNRAHLVVFRSPDGQDSKHHFEVDSAGTVRIWRTWLSRDSLMYVGDVGEDGQIVLRDAVTSARMLTLGRVEGAF